MSPSYAASALTPPRWDTAWLFPSGADDLAELCAAAGSLRETYAGRLADLALPEIATLLDRLGAVRDRISAVAARVTVLESFPRQPEPGDRDATEAGPDGAEPNGAGPDDAGYDVAIQRGRDAIAEAIEQIGFFDDEWLSLPAERAAALADAPELSADSYLLHSMNRLRGHLLAPEQEAVLASREESASDSWIQLYRRTIARTRVAIDGSALTLDEAVRIRRSDPDRTRRRRAAEAIHAALEGPAEVAAACYDALVADRLAIDGLRGFNQPRAWSDLENDLPGERVDAMLAYVAEHGHLARDFFRGKAAVLGLDRLTSLDEHAPVPDAARHGGPQEIDWDRAVALVRDAFAAVDPAVGRAAAEIVAGGNLDAAPRVGKTPNPYCLDAGRTRAPLISMNFTGQPTDVLTLAHEVGHAVHFTLAGRIRSGLSYDGPTVVSEAAATLLELAVRRHMMTTTDLLPAQIAMQSSIDSLFRQVMLTRFEERAYAARAGGVPLTVELLRSIWRAVTTDFYGDALEVLPSFDLDWMRIEHFIQSRFYNYSYVLVHLCALAVTSRLTGTGTDTGGTGTDGGADVGARIAEFLSLGGSASPDEQFRVLQLDLTTGDLWTAGLGELGRLATAVRWRSSG